LRLSQSLRKPWILEGLKVLSRNVFVESVIQLLLPRGRKRKRDGFGECHAWIVMPALLFLLLNKYQWNSLLGLNPMGVALRMLNSMGVALLMLIPMGVTLPELIPMGVTLPELIPMGVTLPELIPMGVTLCSILSVLLTRMRKKKRKSPQFERTVGVTESVGGVVIFLLQLCLLSLVCKNYP
jgi:hypothetical protein